MKRLMLLAMLLTAACHASATALPATSPTPGASSVAMTGASPTNVPWASWSVWGDTQPTLVPGTCGSAAVRVGDPTLVYGGATSIRCFAQAASNCHAASLSWRRTGVDSGTEVHATVRSDQQPCTVTYVTNDFSANGGGRTYAAATFICGLSVVANRIDFHCPTFDDDVPVS